MNVTFQIDSTKLENSLGQFAGQVPFILQKAINDTVVDAQKAVISRANDVFTIRRQQFLKQTMKITQFAKKDNLQAVLQVSDIGGQKTADVFGKFEVGGNKRPFNGSRLAVPTEFIKPKNSRVISAIKRPRTLKNSWKGKTKQGREAIFQRRGKGKRETINVAYVLKPSVRIDNRLRFTQTSMDRVRETFAVNTDKWVLRALSTAKLK